MQSSIADQAAIPLEPYGIEQHKHLFAAWAAGRAASVKEGRFRVEQAREMLQRSGFTAELSAPNQLPQPSEIDQEHLAWRLNICAAAESLGLSITHGIAAKLLNVYLKVRFVCGGYHDNERVAALHPPIDDVLLQRISEVNFGNRAAEWKRVRRIRWSKLDSLEYEQLISLLRQNMNGRPFWQLEEYWRGNQ